jgi:hypothetical protein
MVTMNKNEHHDLTPTDDFYKVSKIATLFNTNQPAPNLSNTREQSQKSTVINEHQTSVKMKPIKINL